jgi:hypothetical protein
MLLKWPVWTPPFWLYWALTKIKVIQPKKIWMQKGMSFAHYQAQEWKVVLSSAKFDPHKNDPLTAQPKTPMEWLRDENIRLTKREGLDEQGAADAFERQLGPSWQGLEKAPLHVKAIWVLSALNLSRDKRLATIRDRLTEIYSAGGGNTVNEVKALLSPVLKDKKFKTFFLQRGARHAFTNTATIGIYGRCGPMKEWEGGHTGVLPTSNFLWLLPLDRTLFFALNNVGRRSFHIEGAGAIAHYHAERVSGGPMASPQVDHAVDGLIKYLDMQTVTDIQEFFHIEKVFD